MSFLQSFPFLQSRTCSTCSSHPYPRWGTSIFPGIRLHRAPPVCLEWVNEEWEAGGESVWEALSLNTQVKGTSGHSDQIAASGIGLRLQTCRKWMSESKKVEFGPGQERAG